MTQTKDNQGMSNQMRYILAAVLVCSALLLGVVAPVKAMYVYFDTDLPSPDSSLSMAVEYEITNNGIVTPGSTDFLAPGYSRPVTWSSGRMLSYRFPTPVHMRVHGIDKTYIYLDSSPASGFTTAEAGWDGYIKARYLEQTQPINSPPSVDAVNNLIIVDEGIEATNTGTWSDTNAGDSVTLTPTIGTVTKTGTNAGGAWSWSYSTTDGPAQSGTVTITANDGKGGVTTTSFQLTVENVAPTVGTITAPVDPIRVGTPITVQAPFSDPGAMDAPFTAAWTWDAEMTSDPGTVSEGSVSVSGSHSYSSPGIYPVSVIVTDKDGGASIAATTSIVVYDPSAGFATGGGWFNSPAGAYTADGDLTGKANFGFVSKYKKDTTVPECSVEFQFKQGDLNFKSSSCDWLVVEGSKATCQGTGTINGAGNYQFVLSAIDGSLDTFGIQIKDIDNEYAVVYDNQASSLGGGNIVVHT